VEVRILVAVRSQALERRSAERSIRRRREQAGSVVGRSVLLLVLQRYKRAHA